MVFLTVVDSCA